MALAAADHRSVNKRGKPSICLLALSQIVDDPRVRRQGDLFAATGWAVNAIGLPGGTSAPPGWPIRSDGQDPTRRGPSEARADGGNAPESATARSAGLRGLVSHYLARWPRLRRLVGAAWHLARQMLHRVLILLLCIDPRSAGWIFWHALAISRKIRGLHAAASGIGADIWLANDWTALPLAARLARERGGIYVYDTHEFATEEYAEKPAWRRWTRPIVAAIERKYIGDAAVVSAVSAGIAERLDAMYRLPRPTLVVRNTPRYEACPFRATGNRIRVLYHGVVSPGRGLEVAIDSVARWHPQFDLTIRGPDNPEFTPALRQRIAALRLGDRVQLAPPVPMTALVREAVPFDIGFFALPNHSRHNEFALPNKIFEYIMAGLCLCTTHLPEMAAIIERYQLGVTIPVLDADAIARAINSLDRDRIDECKRRALAVARDLCWERESERLVSAYTAAAAAAAA